MAVNALVTVAVGALMIPEVRTYVAEHPEIAGLLSLLAGGFAAVEKSLSIVLPLQPTPPPQPGEHA
jgi:hypothetical protein